MNVLRFGLATCLALTCLSRDAEAITTSLDQFWNFAPDAWSRGNDADTAWFGWDVLEDNNPLLGFARILDDTTPDLGGTTTALNPRLFQGNDGTADPSPTIYGHRSGSGNYYSGFGANDVADDTVTGIAPASGAGGFTTVVLQAIGQPGSPVEDLEFTMDASWTKVNELYGVNGSGAGLYWQEWTAPGDNLPLAIRMTSPTSSRALDALQIDTFWSVEGSVVNGITAVPEPGSILLAGLGTALVAVIATRRRAA